MTIETKVNSHGQTEMWMKNADGRGTCLTVEHMYVRVFDGRVFSAPPNLKGMLCLSPTDAEMAKHWFATNDVPKPDIVVGDPA